MTRNEILPENSLIAQEQMEGGGRGANVAGFRSEFTRTHTLDLSRGGDASFGFVVITQKPLELFRFNLYSLFCLLKGQFIPESKTHTFHINCRAIYQSGEFWCELSSFVCEGSQSSRSWYPSAS